jgi:ABC-type multidrug transport system ATPase subunit
MTTLIAPPLPACTPGTAGTAHGAGTLLVATRLRRNRRDGSALLRDVSVRFEPGELVAIVGSSGAGKTTLLDALAGVHPADDGEVCFDGMERSAWLAVPGNRVGYVPQDDIVHRDLPVRDTLRYAARLRLPHSLSPAEIDAIVDDVIEVVDLGDHAATVVGSLSGGQRKRASIAVELLRAPSVFFLDEPTSGLDPATASALIATLRHLTTRGCTVVLTTHSRDDMHAADRVVELGAGGVLLHDRSTTPRGSDLPPRSVPVTVLDPATDHDRPTAISQWATLVRRNTRTLRHNRLTLALMLGSPVLVIAMFAVLFPAGVFDGPVTAGDSRSMVAYWMAFAAFFFGLTFGLLQICVEMPVLRRERFAGLGLGAYLAAKLTVTAPVLFAVDTVMLLVLRATGRLPDADAATYASLSVTLLATAVTALALGLLASAAVLDASQATIALPMLCFPAVLFAGAMVPVPAMTTAGRAIAAVTPARWAYEGVADPLDVATRAGAATAGATWLILAAFAAAFLGAAHQVLRVRMRGLW